MFRLETLPAYAVESDGEDYHRWLAGEPEPSWERKQPWLDTISRWRVTGMIYRRVRILSEQLTDYERYAAEFGYAYSCAAGEDVRVLRRGEHTIPDGLIEHDFWMINDDVVLTMVYDQGGRFERSEVVGDTTAYLHTRDTAWMRPSPSPPGGRDTRNCTARPPYEPTLTGSNDGGTDRERLGRSLRTLRESAELRQVDAADHIGITQAKLSRFEQGRALLEPDDVAGLARLYRADADEARNLIGLAADVQAGYSDERIVFQGGRTANLQRRFAELEDAAAHVRAYQPAVVTGAMQTAGYAAAVLGTQEDDPLVRQRLARQQRMLDDPRRRWTFIQTEGALRWQARSASVMAEQIEHLVGLSHIAHVDVGVIDWRTPVEIFPSTGFHLYDDSAVVVGIRDGTSIMRAATRLADYRGVFDRLARLAAFGEDARTILHRIADDYRDMIDAR